MLKRIWEMVAFLTTIYTVGLACGIAMRILERNGKIVVQGREHLFGHPGGTLIVSNHPSLLETILLPLLYFPHFLTHPFLAFPWSTPDRKNFMSKWYFRLFAHTRMIFVDRDSPSPASNMRVVRKIISVLWAKGTVILFPEGGRTFKRPLKMVSQKNKELGTLSRSVECILRNARSAIVPVWVEGCDKALPPGKYIPRFVHGPVIIKIGEPIRQRISAENLQHTLLRIADEV
jgi:1-acyl-sn-glycerol-3-phosphate acyltransferase